MGHRVWATAVGLINSALYLACAEGRDSPVPDPIGSDEHRKHRLDSTRQRSANPKSE